jgi:MoxR-like ATPase
MLKLTMSQLKNLLPIYIKANTPVMIWGGPGEGKSGLVKSVVEKIGADLQDFRLLMRDAVDVHGLPDKNEDGRMVWSYPKEMPLASDKIEKTRVMFLDELPAAPTNVQTVAYQMLHERAIDDTPLHENVRFVAAGNRERDGAVSNRMPTPLANRMAHFDVEADVNSWLSWAHGAGQNPYVLAHIENSPQDLRVADIKEYTTNKAFRSPRAWEYTSNVLKIALQGNDGTISDGDISMMEDIVASFVGAPTAANFRGYIEVGAKLPKPREILEGSVKAKRFELHEQFFISCGVLAQLAENRKLVEVRGVSDYQNDPEFMKGVDNALGFVKDSFDAETLASFLSRFVNRDFYGFHFSSQSAVQKAWAQSVFGGKEGHSRLIFAS